MKRRLGIEAYFRGDPNGKVLPGYFEKGMTLNAIDGEPVTFGPRVNIEDLSEADARAIFGDGVYETWLAIKDDPSPGGTVTVTSIDSAAGTITFDSRPRHGLGEDK